MTFVTWRKEIKVAHGMNVANQLVITGGNDPRASGWAQCMQEGVRELQDVSQENRVLPMLGF